MGEGVPSILLGLLVFAFWALVLRESDVLVVGAPHRAYRTLELDAREVVDIWGVTGPIRL